MSDLMRRLLNLIYHIEEKKVKAEIITWDIFKAFDSVEWPTLKKLIQQMGFGRKFQHIITKLYTGNKASVLVNDGITEQFNLSRGTRQGCPLSPILFVLMIVLLANVIRKGKDIEEIGQKEKVKISLFADSTLLTILEPLNALNNIQGHLEDFEEVTGLKINWDKSEMILSNNSRGNIEEIKKKYKIKVLDNFKYLGVNITKQFQNIKTMNFERKLKKK